MSLVIVNAEDALMDYHQQHKDALYPVSSPVPVQKITVEEEEPAVAEQSPHSRLQPKGPPSLFLDQLVEEWMNVEVIPVKCKDASAELHKSKLGQGNRGKCIKYGDQWLTPKEFEEISGRKNSKDWKRSIRCGGRNLQSLIDQGYLAPHAHGCFCYICADDSGSTGPIRHYARIQRKRPKRKTKQDDTSKSKLQRLLQSNDCTDNDSSDVGSPREIIPNLNPLTKTMMRINQKSPSTTEEAWKNLEDMVNNMTQASLLMKDMVKDVRERTATETSSLKSQLQEEKQKMQQNLQKQTKSEQTQTPEQQQEQQSSQITVNGSEFTNNLMQTPQQFIRVLGDPNGQTFSFDTITMIPVTDSETFGQLKFEQF